MNLYPRTTGGSPRPEIQRGVMARRILDRARKGEQVREDLVDWALTQTGDVRPLKPEEAAHCLQRQSDLYESADDMAEWGARNPLPTRARVLGEQQPKGNE